MVTFSTIPIVKAFRSNIHELRPPGDHAFHRPSANGIWKDCCHTRTVAALTACGPSEAASAAAVDAAGLTPVPRYLHAS